MTGKTDYELLELAAKAAGIEIDSWISTSKRLQYAILAEEKDGRDEWNPLEDDGDALRLAVILRLDICTEENDAHPTEDRQICHVNVWPSDGGNGFSEDRGIDPYAATRRAIVHAAAAIGEKMP